jgi:hypothetical protein
MFLRPSWHDKIQPQMNIRGWCRMARFGRQSPARVIRSCSVMDGRSVSGLPQFHQLQHAPLFLAQGTHQLA